MQNTSLIYKLIIDPTCGAELGAVCKQAFLLSDFLGLEVQVVHNGRRYKVGLSIVQVAVEKSTPYVEPTAPADATLSGEAKE